MSASVIVLALLSALFVDYDPVAAEKLLAKDYIQHNPVVPTGSAPIIGFVPKLKKSGMTVTTHRTIAEGDLVVTHNLYTNAQAMGSEKMVSFDVFRVENGLVAEHWDNLAPMTPPNPSGRTQLDGATQIVDRNKTKANKALVTEMIEAIFIGEEGERLAEFISDQTYIQHNSTIADGLEGLGAAFKEMAEQGIKVKYTQVHKVIAEGNFVFTMSEGLINQTPTAFFDLFRVDGGKIVEHWDIVSEIPGEMAHKNGKF